MLQQVDFITKRGQELSLVLGDVSTGVILTEIAGLDPVKATLVSTTFAQRDGTQHQAARRESRDIIVRMSLDSRFGGAPIYRLRQDLYKIFMPKNAVKLVFHQTDLPNIEIEGIIEDVASERFTDDPTFGMAIRCNNPDFVDPVAKTYTGEGFPASMNFQSVEYEGTVDSGLEFEIDLSGSGIGTGFVLQQITPNGDTRSLMFTAQVANHDTILINTNPGHKEVLLRRAGSATSILYGIDPQSQWPILEPGINQIGVQVTGGSHQSYYEFHYYDRYGAV